MGLPIDTNDDESCMQKFYCIGRAERTTDGRIESKWPCGFIKQESQALKFLTGKLEPGQTLKAIWVGNFDEDKNPVLKFGDAEIDADRRVPQGMYANWKEHWDKDKPSAPKERVSRKMEAKLEAARVREATRKEQERIKKEEAKNVYALPYGYFFAPPNCEDQ